MPEGGEFRLCNTICEPTSERQNALKRLVEQDHVDLILAIGGRKSSNTARLAEIGHALGVRSHHIERPEEIDDAWLADVDVVGVTAGASTPDDVIEAVVAELGRRGYAPPAGRHPPHRPGLRAGVLRRAGCWLLAAGCRLRPFIRLADSPTPAEDCAAPHHLGWFLALPGAEARGHPWPARRTSPVLRGGRVLLSPVIPPARLSCQSHSRRQDGRRNRCRIRSNSSSLNSPPAYRRSRISSALGSGNDRRSRSAGSAGPRRATVTRTQTEEDRQGDHHDPTEPHPPSPAIAHAPHPAPAVTHSPATSRDSVPGRRRLGTSPIPASATRRALSYQPTRCNRDPSNELRIANSY